MVAARVLFAAATISFIAGCGGSPAGGTGGAPSTAQLAPKAVLQRLIELRRARRYPEMLPLIVGGQSQIVMDTLIAVDGFLAANERLRALVRDTVGSGLADEVDQSPLAVQLEIFSRSVSFYDEKIDGDTARVGYIANDQLPLRQALLVRTAAGWCYDPGAGGDARIGEAYKQMARALDQCTEELRSNRIPTADLNYNPQPLFNEINTRLSPGLRELKQLASAARR